MSRNELLRDEFIIFIGINIKAKNALYSNQLFILNYFTSYLIITIKAEFS